MRVIRLTHYRIDNYSPCRHNNKTNKCIPHKRHSLTTVLRELQTLPRDKLLKMTDDHSGSDRILNAHPKNSNARIAWIDHSSVCSIPVFATTTKSLPLYPTVESQLETQRGDTRKFPHSLGNCMDRSADCEQRRSVVRRFLLVTFVGRQVAIPDVRFSLPTNLCLASDEPTWRSPGSAESLAASNSEPDTPQVASRRSPLRNDRQRLPRRREFDQDRYWRS